MATAAPARTAQRQTNAVARVDVNQQMTALAAELDRRQALMAESAASLIDPVKMKGIVLSTFSRTPSLWDCDPISIARAVVEASQAGLMPTGSLGGAYLVPFWNSKTGKREAQLIIGYTGLVQLARRSGEVIRCEARVVRAADEFAFGYGLDPYLTHTPAMGVPEDANNPLTHAYAVATFRDGSKQFDVMSAAEILAIKARSKSRDREGNPTGPWVTDEAEMWKKTPLRRLSKMLPLTIEAQRVLDSEEETDFERAAGGRSVAPGRSAAPSRIAARLGATTSAAPASPSADQRPVQADTTGGTPSDPAAAEPSPEPASGEGDAVDGEAIEWVQCPSVSPYDGSTPCQDERGSGHPGNHTGNGKETWS
jgi:recombination protein RecT